MADMTPASPAPKRRRRWRGWAIGVGATLTTLLVILAVVIVSGLLLLSGPFGREVVRETVNGREIAGYGEVEIGAVSGNVLGRFEIDRIRVRDADGVWLDARDVTIAWSPWALRRYVLRIETFTVSEVTMSRRPVRAERPPSDGRFDLSSLPGIRVGEARFDAIRLAEGVAGPAAVYALSGDLRHDGGRWLGELDAQRTDAVGDRLLAEIDFSDTVALDARFDAPPGGLLSRLLDAETQGATGVVTASGTLDEGAGDAEIYIGDDLAVDARLTWANRVAQASGQVRPDAWSRLARISQLLGGTLSVEARAPLGREGITAPDISGLTALIEAPNARLQVAMTAPRIGQIELEARSALVALATNDAVQAEHLAIDGVADLSGENPVFTGEIAGRAVTLPGGIRMGAVSGPVSTQGGLDAPRINTELAVTGASYDVDALDRLIGQTPHIAADFTFVREDTSIEMHSYTARLPTGVFAGSGGVSVPERRWRMAAQSDRARFNRLVDLIEGEGAIALNAAGDFDGALSFDAQLDGFTPAGELAERLEAPLSASVSGRREAGGGLYLDVVSAEGPQFVLEARGEQTGDDWRFNGDLAWSGSSPLAALTLEGALEAAFEAQYGPEGLDVRLDATAGALSAGPLGITGARLRVEASGPLDALSGAGRLTGASDRGPVDVAAEFARDGETLQLSRLNGQLAAVRIDGTASVGPEIIAADLIVSPVSGFGEMSLQAELREGMIAVRAEAEDIVGEDLAYLDRFLLTLNGPLDAVAMRLEADGAYGAAFNAEADGVLRLTGEPGAQVTLDGRYGPFAIATLEPIEVQAGPVPSLDLALRIGNGELRASGSGGDAPSITARLEAVPAGILSLRRARSPVIGLLSGDLTASRADGVWRADATLSGSGLRPLEAPDAEDLAGEVRLVLDETGLTLTASAEGVGLTARANGQIASGPVGGPDDLMRPGAALSGEALVEGEIGALAAFHLAAAQTLSGEANVSARLTGTVGTPRFEGSLGLEDGVFRDGRAGLAVEAISLLARFSETSLIVERLTATDGDAGTLSGAGEVSIVPEGLGMLEADLNVDFRRFRLAGSPDLEAIGTGDVRFQFADEEGLITGAAVIDRAEIRPPEASRPSIPYITVTEINAPGGNREARERATPIRLNYAVSAPARIFVRGPNFDTEWSMNLEITGTLDAPYVSGVINAERGRADMLGRVFQLEAGRVTLNGDPGEAQLDISLAREARDITARVRVRGTARDPRIALASTPALPEDEIAARLVFGEGAANLSAVEYAQLAASLASLSGGSAFDPLGALRTVTGLDTFGVRTDSGGQTVVAGGRYLTDTVYLELESAGSDGGPTTRIEWALTRSISLLSRLRGDGDASVAVSWRTEYD